MAHIHMEEFKMDQGQRADCGPTRRTVSVGYSSREIADKLAQQGAAQHVGCLAPASIDHGPGSILLDKLGELMGQSDHLVQALSGIHAKLGGPLPDRATSTERPPEPTPCGGAIGGAIQASRSIGVNLDRADDLLGYLRALIA